MPIVKNYLSEDEISRLNRLVNRFLDDTEGHAEDGILTSMQDCVDGMDDSLHYSIVEGLPISWDDVELANRKTVEEWRST